MTDSERIVAIEAKLAHQELVTSELSDVIYRQQQQIDQLQRHCKQLALRLKEISGLVDSDRPEDSPPPHY